MPRTVRPHAPGKAFHITARTQGREKWFVEEVRDQIAYFICEAAAACNNTTLSFVVMSNHFHIVMRQGPYPVGWMMQRVMQRTTHVVKRLHGVIGHVFGGPYWSCVCPDPDYVRAAIVYAHLNPVDAEMCADAADYRWSMHCPFIGRTVDAPWVKYAAVSEGRALFANDLLPTGAVIRNYLRCVAHTLHRRKTAIPGEKYLFGARDMSSPQTGLGDHHWVKNYSHAVETKLDSIARMDLRDKAIAVLLKLDPDCDIDMIRHAGHIKRLCHMRRNLIAALLSLGYKAAAISRCLRVSASVVSDVARTLRSPSPTP